MKASDRSFHNSKLVIVCDIARPQKLSNNQIKKKKRKEKSTVTNKSEKKNLTDFL